MQINQIVLGAAPNDGKGEPIRNAFAKINLNFSNVSAELESTKTELSKSITASMSGLKSAAYCEVGTLNGQVMGVGAFGVGAPMDFRNTELNDVASANLVSSMLRKGLRMGLSQNGNMNGVSNGGTYGALLTLAPWTDISAYEAFNQIYMSRGDLYIRGPKDTVNMGSFKKVATVDESAILKTQPLDAATNLNALTGSGNGIRYQPTASKAVASLNYPFAGATQFIMNLDNANAAGDGVQIALNSSSDGMAFRRKNTAWSEVLHSNNTDKDVNGFVRSGGSKTALVTTDLVDNLTSFDSSKALSAAQGKYLNEIKLNRSDIQAPGNMPLFALRAWIYLDSRQNPPKILGSGNIKSVTDIGTSRMLLTFETPMIDANYAVLAMGTDTWNGVGVVGKVTSTGGYAAEPVTKTINAVEVALVYDTLMSVGIVR